MIAFCRLGTRRAHVAHLVQPGRYLVSSCRHNHWLTVAVQPDGAATCECGQLDCGHVASVRKRLARCRLELTALEAA